MRPVLLSLGPVALPGYGAFAALAMLVAVAWAAWREQRPGGIGALAVAELSLWVTAAGLVAARLPLLLGGGGSAMVLASGGYFDAGVLGGLAAGWAWARRAGVPFAPLADRLVPAAPLAGAVGRLGCLAAGCCWGTATALPWAVVYREPLAQQMTGVPLGQGLHPTPLYLLAAQGIILLILLSAAAARLPAGGRVALWAVLEGAARLAIDPLRGDARGRLGFLSLPALLALLLLVLGGGALLRARRA